MEGGLGTQLAESMLEAAGSLHQLQEELDRISLQCSPEPGGSGQSRAKRSKKYASKSGTSGSAELTRRHREPRDQDAISQGSSESYERPSSRSSSSPFDSAIGSLHSQTDNDSLSSQLFLPPTPPSYHQPPPSTLTASLHAPAPLHSGAVAEGRVEQYFSPQLAIPTIVTAERAPREHTSQRIANINVEQSLKGNRKTVTVMGTQVQLRQKIHKPKAHHQLTAEDTRRHFKWLESSELARAGIHITPEQSVTSSAERGNMELESEGSSSTVVAEEVEADAAVVGNEIWQRECQGMTPTNNGCTLKSIDSAPKGLMGIYPDSVTPKASPSVPQRYLSNTQVNILHHCQNGSSNLLQEGEERQRQMPRRNASILQRLRRKRGSFRQDMRPRRRIPVQRSLSDRFVYHLNRKRDGHNEELYPISTPSLLRPIGRLLRTYAGRLHIVQLHKPANGRYDIYIRQGADRKIFISRFATATAEKFYSGLLSPGDEIVSVNKQKTRGKSLDSVYTALSQLDSVIIAVVPVTAHRNW